MGGKGGVASGVRDRLFLKGPRPHLGWRSAQSQPSPRSRHNPMGPPHVIPPTPQNHLMGPPYALFPPPPTVVPPPPHPHRTPYNAPPSKCPMGPLPPISYTPSPRIPHRTASPSEPPLVRDPPPIPPHRTPPQKKSPHFTVGGGHIYYIYYICTVGFGGGSYIY